MDVVMRAMAMMHLVYLVYPPRARQRATALFSAWRFRARGVAPRYQSQHQHTKQCGCADRGLVDIKRTHSP